MTYTHYEPPVAYVSLYVWDFPKEMAETALMYAWAGYYTGVSHCLLSLAQYRKIAHQLPSEQDEVPFSTDSVMNFAAHHVCFGTPEETLGEVQRKRAKELAVQLLDLIKFFEGIEIDGD